MLKVIKYEIRRFLKFYLILLFTCLFFFLVDINRHTVTSYQYQALIIEIITAFLAYYLIIKYIRDEYTDKKYLYIKSSLSPTQVFVGKLLTIIILSCSFLFIMTFFYNLKLYFLYKKHYLDFLRLNLDYTYLALIGREYKEWLYPLHFSLGIIYNTIIFYLMYTIYAKRRMKRYSKLSSIIISYFIPAGIFYVSNYFVKLLDKFFHFLDFSNLTPRVRAFSLREHLINILSINSLIILLVSLVLMVRYITRKRSDNQCEN